MKDVSADTLKRPRDEQIQAILPLLSEAASDAANISDRFRYVACKRAIRQYHRELKDIWNG